MFPLKEPHFLLVDFGPLGHFSYTPIRARGVKAAAVPNNIVSTAVCTPRLALASLT